MMLKTFNNDLSVNDSYLNDLDYKIKDKWYENEQLVIEQDGYFFAYGDADVRLLGSIFVAFNEISQDKERYIFIYPVQDVSKEVIKHTIHQLTKDRLHTYIEVFAGDSSKLKELKPPLEELGYPFLMACIDKKLTDSQQNKEYTDDFNFRLANENDIPDIMNCLRKAYIEGADIQGITYDQEELYENIEKIYTPLLTSQRVVFICEDRNRNFCGHATFEIEESAANLVDMYIEEPYQNRGLARLLSKYSEHELSRRNIDQMTATLISKDGVDQLLRSFSQTGWSLYSFVYQSKQSD